MRENNTPYDKMIHWLKSNIITAGIMFLIMLMAGATTIWTFYEHVVRSKSSYQPNPQIKPGSLANPTPAMHYESNLAYIQIDVDIPDSLGIDSMIFKINDKRKWSIPSKLSHSQSFKLIDEIGISNFLIKGTLFPSRYEESEDLGSCFKAGVINLKRDNKFRLELITSEEGYYFELIPSINK